MSASVDMSPFHGPSLDHLHTTWSAYLTSENVKAVAEHMRVTLAGGYFWAEYNEGLPGCGLRVDQRELRPATSEPTGVVWGIDNGRSHITVCDSYGVWGLHSTLAKQPPWGFSDEDDEVRDKRKWSSAISWGRSASVQTLAYHIEHLVPAGHLTRWTVMPLTVPEPGA